jgi:hypothetical protein
VVGVALLFDPLVDCVVTGAALVGVALLFDPLVDCVVTGAALVVTNSFIGLTGISTIVAPDPLGIFVGSDTLLDEGNVAFDTLLDGQYFA